MTVFEPWPSGIGNNRGINCATIIAIKCLFCFKVLFRFIGQAIVGNASTYTT